MLLQQPFHLNQGKRKLISVDNLLLNVNLNTFYFLIVKKTKASNQRQNVVKQITLSSGKNSVFLNYI